jgi:hypothetical protein
MKKITLILIIGLLVVAAVSVVSAQGRGPNDDPERPRQPISFQLNTRTIELAGLDVTEAQQRMAEGTLLIDILIANGVDLDVLEAKLTASIAPLLDDAVASGRMEQARAEERMSHVRARFERMRDCLRAGSV